VAGAGGGLVAAAPSWPVQLQSGGVLGDRPAVHPGQPGQQARTNAAIRRRGSTRANRAPTRSISSSNSRRHRSRSTLRPAAMARSSVVHTPSDHRAMAASRLRAVTLHDHEVSLEY